MCWCHTKILSYGCVRCHNYELVICYHIIVSGPFIYLNLKVVFDFLKYPELGNILQGLGNIGTGEHGNWGK